MNKRILLITSALITCSFQVSGKVDMADTMRSDGKIYVVVAVLATIFAGIFGYLIYIDQKLAKTEKQSK